VVVGFGVEHLAQRSRNEAALLAATVRENVSDEVHAALMQCTAHRYHEQASARAMECLSPSRWSEIEGHC
jgi:hypothetical protein